MEKIPEEEVITLSNPVLAFMHCWSLGNHAKEILKAASTSFSEEQIQNLKLQAFKTKELWLFFVLLTAVQILQYTSLMLPQNFPDLVQ